MFSSGFFGVSTANIVGSIWMKYGDFKHVAHRDHGRGSTPFARVQRLSLSPSRRFLRGLSALHVAVAGLLLFDLHHQPLAWAMACALLLHVPLLAIQWRRDARPFLAALLAPDGSWWLETTTGGLVRVRLGSTRFVTGRWLLLPLRLAQGGGVTLCLMCDNLESQDFRRLRVRLLWGRAG